MPGQKRGPGGEALPSENFPTGSVTSFSEPHFRYRATVAEVAPYHDGARCAQASHTDAAVSSSDYYDDEDGEDDLDLVALNAADGSLEHTVLKSNFTEVQEMCRRADVALSSSIIVVADFALRRVTATVAGDVYCNDPLRRTADVSELQIKYDRLVGYLSSVASKIGTWPPLARERTKEIYDL